MSNFEWPGDMLAPGDLQHLPGHAARRQTRRVASASADVSLSSEEASGDAVDPDSGEEAMKLSATGAPHRALHVVASDKQVGDVAAQAASSPVCPKCKGARWVRSSQDLPPWHPDYQKSVECECLLQERREKRKLELLALSGLPEECPTLQTFRPHVRGVMQAYRTTEAFINQAGTIGTCKGENQRRAILKGLKWVVLIGPVGVGKTHLAIAAAAAAVEFGMETLFLTAPDLLDHLRAAFAPSSTVAYDELFERMKTAELLVLDDLGAQRSTSWVEEKLFQLFNYRYDRRLPTVVTLNEKAWGHLDERLQSRLSDHSLVEVVSLREAQDYRPRQGKPAAPRFP